MAAAAGALQAGGLVAVPTDTVYGVACLAQDSAAVRSIYSLKGRNGAKPLAICLGDVERLYRWARPGRGARWAARRSRRGAAPPLAGPEPHGRDGRAVLELPEVQWPGRHRVHTLIQLSLALQVLPRECSRRAAARLAPRTSDPGLTAFRRAK